jgi:glycosyltransferase involved in cell wall biosynthesis
MRVFMLDLLSIVPYYTAHLCAGLAQVDGIEVTLASITYHHDPECFRRQGLRNAPGPLDIAARIPAPATMRRVLKLAEWIVNMAALPLRLAIARPDVLHVQFLPLCEQGLPFERWLLRAVRALGVPIVYTVHNVLPQETGDRLRPLYRRIYALPDRFVCHDALSAERLATGFEIPADRISIIPHGPFFDGDRRPPEEARARLGFAPGQCLVLWQGIVRPYKGVSFLLKAWRRVCDSGAPAQLAIVGTGDAATEREIAREVRDLAVGTSVRLDLRFVSVGELEDYYQAADVLVYPYSEITTSGALMTGIVRGKAVIASALPAFEQVLRHGDNALLVRYGDVEALAASLLLVIRDPDLRAALGRRLQRTQAAVPGWHEIAARTCECYHSVLSGQARRRTEAART